MDTATRTAVRELACRLAGEAGGWRGLARCAETDPEIFFPEKGESVGPAKRVCAGCEVRDECLQDALDRGERFGVWGGLSERERRALAGQPHPARSCPEHGEELSGGPVLYRCPAGRHRVTATDLETATEAGKDAA